MQGLKLEIFSSIQGGYQVFETGIPLQNQLSPNFYQFKILTISCGVSTGIILKYFSILRVKHVEHEVLKLLISTANKLKHVENCGIHIAIYARLIFVEFHNL